jgi:outer membrane biosynthesis protein TonB
MALAEARLLLPPPPARREGRALALATLAHLALIAVASLGWQWTSRPLPPANEPIPIDFVDIADVPRIPAPPKPSLEAAPQDSAPPPALEPLPVPDIAEPEPKPEPKPQPKPLDTATLSNLIDKALPKAKTKPLDTSALAKTIEAAQPKGAKIDPRAAATLAQAIRAQVAPCWNPPIGGEDVRKMTVLIAADYNRDGSLAAAPRIVSQTGRTAANADYARAFAETAVRAVLRCQPLKLPANLYSFWQSVEINFDPETMT